MTPLVPRARFYHPAHPLRPPAWRWLRAVDLWLNSELPSAESDDAWVRKTLGLYRVLQRGPEDKALQQRRRQPPALFQAYRLYTAESALRRWEVEARLLTDEPFEQIAAKCGSTPRMIYAYEKVFFNVRDRIEATGYIINVVIGGGIDVSVREDDIGRILKLFAFGGGVAVLEVLLDYFRHPPMLPERPELLPAADLMELRSKLLIKATIVARGLPPNATLFKKLAILDAARTVIDPNREKAAVSPFLLAPSLQTLMSVNGQGWVSPTVATNPASASLPAEPTHAKGVEVGRRTRENKVAVA